MFSFEMRLHRRMFTITHKDKVAFTGGCYLLKNQSYEDNWCKLHPVLPKKRALAFIKEGALVESRKYDSKGLMITEYIFVKCPESMI